MRSGVADVIILPNHLKSPTVGGATTPVSVNVNKSLLAHQTHSTVSPWKWFVLPRRRWWQQTKHRSTEQWMCRLFVACAGTHIIRSDMLVVAGLPLAPGQRAVYRAARAIRRPRSKGAVSLSLAAVQVEETLHATVPSAASCCGVRSRIISYEEAGGLRSAASVHIRCVSNVACLPIFVVPTKPLRVPACGWLLAFYDV